MRLDRHRRLAPGRPYWTAAAPSRMPKAEIGRRPKRRHDLARIFPRLLKGHVFRHAFLAGIVPRSPAHLRIIDQPLDHVVAPRQFEGLNRPRQPLVQPRHRPLGRRRKNQRTEGNRKCEQRSRLQNHDQDDKAQRGNLIVCVMAKPYSARMARKNRLTCMDPARKSRGQHAATQRIDSAYFHFPSTQRNFIALRQIHEARHDDRNRRKTAPG